MTKRKKLKISIIIFAAGCLLYILLSSVTPREANYIYQLAYDQVRRSYTNPDDITVYIQENGAWEPFLVLESRYPGQGNGGTLLLRRYVLERRKPWHLHQHWVSMHPYIDTSIDGRVRYYPISFIDYWLNTEYFYAFTAAFQHQILATNIYVEAFLWAPPQERYATQVPRNIFLLSETEVGWASGFSNQLVEEGQQLTYFNRGTRLQYLTTDSGRQRRDFRLATQREFWPSWELPAYVIYNDVEYRNDFGITGRTSWWLRTERRTIVSNTISAVSIESGVVRPVGSNDFAFVRPAFTIPRNTPVQQYEIEPGRFVNIIY